MSLSPELLEHLCATPVRDRLPSLVEQNPKLRDRAVILELAEQVNRLTREDIDRAERLADVLSWLSELVSDEFGRARALRCLGNVRVLRSNYQDAIRYFEDSLQIFRQLEIEEEEAAGLSSFIQPLMYLGDYVGAFSYAQCAKEIATRRGDELLLARLEVNFGNILHRQDRFSDAVASYQAALAALTRLGQFRDCAIAYLNLAVCYISLNDLQAAERAYRQARVLSESQNMWAITAQADYNIAYLCYHRGEYGKAIELYQQTRRYCQKVGDSFHSALCDLDQAELYLDLRLNEEASELAKQAQSAFMQLQMPYEAAKAIVWLAVSAYQERRLFRAFELLTAARHQMKGEGNVAWTAILALYQALVLQQEGRYYEALRYCHSAQSLLAEGGLRTVHAEVVRAAIDLDLGRPSQACDRLKIAITAAEKLQDPNLLFQAYRAMGRCYEDRNLPSDALMSYERSLVYLETIPVHAVVDGFKIPSIKDKLDIYQTLIRLRLASSATAAPESALDLVEKFRSREIADLLSFRANSVKTPSRNRSVLVEQLRDLREELSWYYRQTQNAELIDRTRTAEQSEQMRQLIRRREKSLLETLEAMRETEADFHSIQAAGNIPIDKARRCLKDDELLLEIFEASGVVYAGLLTCSTCQILPLTRTALVREHLRRLNAHYSIIASHEQESSGDKGLQTERTLSVLNMIHGALIRPIQGSLGNKRLIIVPSGLLRYVPYHALFDGTHFLTERHILSYSGSASLHFLSATKTRVMLGRDIVVGLADRIASSNIADFSSVDDIDQVRKDGGLRFVHLNSQLSPRLDNPMLSTLLVGRTKQTVFDLFNLQLPCSVMSITGVGPGVRADGNGTEIEGPARALEYAGARTLVFPLWNGPKTSTDFFFDRFYRYVSMDSDAPRAFQTALAAVREKFINPFDWASFIIRGQTGRD